MGMSSESIRMSTKYEHNRKNKENLQFLVDCVLSLMRKYLILYTSAEILKLRTFDQFKQFENNNRVT